MNLLNIFIGFLLATNLKVVSTALTYTPRQVMVDVTNKFGVCILQAVVSRDENVAFSPYGLASVAIILYEGSKGSTAAEIHNALKLPWNHEVTRVGFRDLHRYLKSYFTNDGFLRGLVLSKPNVQIKTKFLKLLRYYGFHTDMEQQFTTPLYNSTTLGGRTDETNTSTTMITTEPSISESIVTNESTIENTIDLQTDISQNNDTSNESTLQEDTSSVPLTTSKENNQEKNSQEYTTLSIGELLNLLIPQTEDISQSLSNDEEKRIPPIKNKEKNSSITTSFPEDFEESTKSTTSQVITQTQTEVFNPITEPIMTPYEVSIIKTTVNSSITTYDPNIVTTEIAYTSKENSSEFSLNVENELSLTTDSTIPTSNYENMSNLENVSLEETNKRRPRSPFNEKGNNKITELPNWILRPQRYQYSYFTPSEHWFFTYNGGSSVPVITYTAFLPFAYITYINALALQLPLDDPRYYMVVLLPEEKLGLERLLDSLSWCSLTTIIADLRMTPVYAVIPAFSTVKHINLGPSLNKLGVRSIFDPFRADLQEMSIEKNIFVRTIEQVVTVSLRKYYNNHRCK